MLTDQNRALLEVLEAKYVAMLGVVSDIVRCDMGDTPEQAELGKYILNQQQGIHEAASNLSQRK